MLIELLGEHMTPSRAGDMPQEDSVQSPIRVQETFARDANGALHLRVFCPRSARSMDVEHCMACPQLLDVSGSPGDPGAALRCAVDGRWVPPADARRVIDRARSFPIASAMSARVICLHVDIDDASIRSLVAREPAITAFPVVDSRGAYVGLIKRGDLEAGESPRLRILSAGAGGAATVLVESAPLSEAVEAITVGHSRFVPVVAEDGISFVGAVTDLDLLRWVVRYR